MAKEEDEIEKRLQDLYYNSEDAGSYRGVDRVFSGAQNAMVHGVTRARVKKLLTYQNSDTINMPDRAIQNEPSNVNGLGGSGRRTWQS